MTTEDFFLSSIRLRNFAVYRNAEIDFDTYDPEKNLYLFIIKNGGGKTSLYHGIKWGFYGFSNKYVYKKENKELKPSDFMNTSAPANEGYAVEIDFISSGKKYTICRECNNPRSGSESVQLTTDEGLLYDSDARDRLNMIIPPNYGHFFMFDGRDLATLTDAQNDKNKVENVIRLVGLDPLQDVKNNLDSIERKLNRDLGNCRTRDKEIEEIQRKFKSTSTKIDDLKDKIQNHKDEMTKVTEDIHHFENLISDAQEAASFNEERNEYRVKKAKIEAELKNNMGELKRIPASIYSMIIRDRLRHIIKEGDARISQIEEITETGVAEIGYDEIRNRILVELPAHCPVCQNKITNEIIERLKNQTAGENISRFRQHEMELTLLQGNKSCFKSLLDRTEPLPGYYTDYFENKYDLERIDEQIEGLETKIRNSGHANLEMWQNNLNARKIKKNRLETDLNSAENDLEKARLEYGRYRKEMETKSGINEELSSLIKQSELSKKLIEKIESITITCINEIRNDILLESNAFFKDMTNKSDLYDRLEYVDDASYSMKIIDKHEKDVENISTGELQIVAMSFLLALSRCSGKTTPIVMDTPTTNLDDMHSEGVERSLAKLPNQIIFLAQPNEASDKFIEGIKRITARRYTTEFESRESAIVKEVES